MSALRKAGSLLVAKRVQDTVRNNKFDYKILYLKRTSQMKFADVLAYPGGVIENGDLDYIKTSNNRFPANIETPHIQAYHSAKVATLRETYEETGLLFLADAPNHETSEIIKNILHTSRENNENPLFYECARQLNLAYEKDIHEVIRLVTIPQMPSRFDCQFFLHVTSPDKTLNLFKAMEHSDHLHNLTDLKIQQEESVGYTWLNPAELLNSFQEKKIKLAPPQFMLANIMLSFPKIDTFVEYLKSIKSKEENKAARDTFERNPLTFPLMLGMSKPTQPDLVEKGYQLSAALQCDPEYPLENCLKLEKDGDFRKELADIVQNMHEDNRGRCRILFKDPKAMFDGDFDFEINTKVDFPYKHMVGKEALKEKLNNLK